MYPAGNLLVPVEHGQLEAIIKEPRVDLVRGVALILHPHPLGGGTMHNKVVFRAANALNDAALITLRINFRGVGQSTGQYDEGRGELDDVRVALHYLKQNHAQQPITICGFSFGARMGLEVGMSDESVIRLISIGTPVETYDFSFVANCQKPILFIHGDQDEIGNVNHLRELVGKWNRKDLIHLSIIRGAGHFFAGHLDELKQLITEWAMRDPEG